MNQLGIVHPSMLTALAPAFYPSALTVQASTEVVGPTGSVTFTWANVTGMVALACRLAPVSANETRTPAQVLTVGTWTCDVGQYLAVTTKHRAVVNGANYDIVAVEYDGQTLPGGSPRSTRLTLKVVT
jgi:hypothetical protein